MPVSASRARPRAARHLAHLPRGSSRQRSRLAVRPVPARGARRRALLAVVLVLFAATAGWAQGRDRRIQPARDPVAATLAGEFALQAGKLDQAADWYLAAAAAEAGDAGLAERATRIALLGTDGARSARAVALWRRAAPGALPLRAAELTLAMRRGDHRAARRALLDLVRSPAQAGGAPGWQQALQALGDGRDPALAARLVGDLLQSGALPGDLQAWLAFGGFAQRLDDAALTRRIVDAVIDRFPDEPRVALLHATQLHAAGRDDEARKVLAGLADAAAADEDLRLSLAAQYDELGELRAAEAVLARGPQDDHSYRLRASLLARADDKAALAQLYETLQRGSSRPDAERRLLLGQTAEFLARYEDALRWYRSVPGGDAQDQARLRAANVLHRLGRDAEAFDALHALQADAALDDDTRRDGYLLEAELRRGDGDAAAELDAYQRGLAAFPDDTALLYARGLAWERRDDIARAEADLRRILVIEPDNVSTLNALGYTLADRTDRYAEALQLIDRARVADPDNAAIVDSYGWVLYRLGRVDEALVQLRRAFGLQKDAEIAAHLGEVLWVSGDKAGARRYFDQSQALDPGNRALQRARARTGA